MYGGLAIAIGAIWWIRERIRESSDVPKAHVVTDDGAWRRTLERWGPTLALVLAIGLFYWSWRHRFEYLVVRDGDSGPSVVRRLGVDRVSDVQLAPGVKPPQNDFGSEPVWVVNLSSRTVRVKSVYYGRNLGWGNEPTMIPPSSSAHFVTIDHIGPHDPPPGSVQDDVNLGMASRDWLTWDE